MVRVAGARGGGSYTALFFLSVILFVLSRLRALAASVGAALFCVSLHFLPPVVPFPVFGPKNTLFSPGVPYLGILSLTFIVSYFLALCAALRYIFNHFVPLSLPPEVLRRSFPVLRITAVRTTYFPELS